MLPFGGPDRRHERAADHVFGFGTSVGMWWFVSVTVFTEKYPPTVPTTTAPFFADLGGGADHAEGDAHLPSGLACASFRGLDLAAASQGSVDDETLTLEAR